MINKGYQIVEPDSLDKLIKSNIRNELKSLILNWIISIIKKSFENDRYNDISIEVISVEYMGQYPAIGLHYFNNKNDNDYGEEIEKIINKITKIDYVSSLINLAISSTK